MPTNKFQLPMLLFLGFILVSSTIIIGIPSKAIYAQGEYYDYDNDYYYEDDSNYSYDYSYDYDYKEHISVDKCEKCILTEINRLEPETASLLLKAISEQYGDIWNLCELISYGKITIDELTQFLVDTVKNQHNDIPFIKNVIQCLFDEKPDIQKKHVVWTGYEDIFTNEPVPGEIFYAKSIDDGQTFSEQVNLSNSPNVDSHVPEITAIGHDVYVLWSELQNDNTGELLLVISNDAGNTFSSPIKVADISVPSINPELEVIGENVYVAYPDNPDGLLPNTDVFFVKSTDGGQTFSDPVNLSNNDGTALFSRIFAVDTRVVIVWDDDTDGDSDILFIQSTDNGDNFGSVTNVSNDDTESEAPDVAVIDDEIYVVYRSEIDPTTSPVPLTDVAFTKSIDNGVSFSDPILLANNMVNDDIAEFTVGLNMGVSDDSVYVVYSIRAIDLVNGIPQSIDLENSGTFIRQSTDNGDSFLPEITLLDFEPWFDPEISVQDDTICVVSNGLFREDIIPIPRPFEGNAYSVTSFDGGITFDDPVQLNNNEITEFMFAGDPDVSLTDKMITEDKTKKKNKHYYNYE